MSTFGLKESGLWFRVDKLLTSSCISAILHPRRTSYRIREGRGDKLRSRPREKPETCWYAMLKNWILATFSGASHTTTKWFQIVDNLYPNDTFFLWANYISLQGTVQSYPWQKWLSHLQAFITTLRTPGQLHAIRFLGHSFKRQQ